jgi:hypothetical protein
MIKIQRELNDETKMILKTSLAVAWFDMLTTLWRSVSCSGPLCAINDEDEETIYICNCLHNCNFVSSFHLVVL